MKQNGLLGLLSRAVSAGDINACCGLLRRLYSETQQEDVLDMPFMASASPAARSSRAGPSPSASPSSVSPQLNALRTVLYQQQQRQQARSSAHREDGVARDTEAGRTTTTTTPPSLAQQVLQLGRVCLTDDPTLVKPSSVSLLCHTAQRAGEWEQALRFCTYLAQPPSPMFVSSLMTPQNVDTVTQYCRAHGWTYDVASAIRVLAERHGSWSEALSVALAAERQFPVGEPYSVAVLVPFLAASGEPERAIQLFRRSLAQGSLVESTLVQHLVLQTATLHQWQVCLHMLHALATTQETTQLLPSSVSFFRRLMEMSPSWQTSLRILNMARASEVKPDTRTVSILLTQCDAAGAWSAATQLYDMAVRERFVESLSLGTTYHALVRSFRAVQQWEKAIEALSWMSKASDASMSAGLCELVDLCVQSGQWEAALEAGNNLIEADGIELIPPQTTLSLLLACGRGAQWAMATALLGYQLHDVRMQPHPLAVCATLQACASARQWVEALRVLHEARAQQPRVVVPPLAHHLALKACVASGRWGEAITLLSVMAEDGLPQDNHSQRLGMWAAALGGRWELSLAFLHRIPVHSRTPQDRILVRSTTRQVSPLANAIALKLLLSR